MNAKDCADITRRMFEQFNTHNLDNMDAYFAANAEVRTVGTIETSKGPEGARADTQRWLSAFSDAAFEIVDIKAGEDFAVAELIFRGTHDAVLTMPDGQSIPATGRRVEGQGCIFLRFDEGKVVSEHDYFDRLDLMEDLGLIPQVGEEPEAEAPRPTEGAGEELRPSP